MLYKSTKVGVTPVILFYFVKVDLMDCSFQNPFVILICIPYSQKPPNLGCEIASMLSWRLSCSTLHLQLSVRNHNRLSTRWSPWPTPREPSTTWNSIMQIRVCVSCRQSWRISHIILALLAKALYRRALAHAYLKTEENAEKDLVEANHLVPEDAVIAAELNKIRQQRKEKREKEKKAYKKMFG